MSAITGILDLNCNTIPSKSEIIKMTNAVKHRGPDGNYHYYADSCHFGCSIFNLSNSKTPLPYVSKSNNLVIVYDGTIYNYEELKTELRKTDSSIQVISESDLIIKSYQAWGKNCFKKFDGIFAIAIWDNVTKSLVMARDRKGLIPLYYYLDTKYLIFSTEIKGITSSNLFKKAINTEGIFEYLCRSLPPWPNTMYKDVFRIMPGSILFFKKNQKLKTEYFCKLEDDWNEVTDLPKKEIDLIKLIEFKLEEAVKKQLIGDLNIGMALSGGIDSNLIFSIFSKNYSKKLNAFTFTNSNQGINEGSRAAAGVSHLNREISHYKVASTYKDTERLIKQSFSLLDSPDSLMRNFVQLMLLNQEAYKKNVPILIAGYGSDLLNCGMPRHRRWYDEGLLENRDIDEWAHILFFGGGINNIRSVEKITGVNREIVKDSMVYKWVYEYKDLEPERRIAIFDQNFHSTTALGGANRASPIQVRSPFWDLDLSKTINAMKGAYKINSTDTKIMMKSVASNLIPQEIINGPKMPTHSDALFWTNTDEFMIILTGLINAEFSFSKNFLVYDEVIKVIESHKKYKNQTHLCWFIFALENWYASSFLNN